MEYEYLGSPDDAIYDINGQPIASGFNRIVHGGRGDYVEFRPDQILGGCLHIPDNAKWRLTRPLCYYIEHRTNAGTKVYEQKRQVNYADYQIGMFYISPKKLSGFKHV